MHYTEPFLRKVETAQEEQQHLHQHHQHQHHQHQHQPQPGVSYRAAVAANNTCINSLLKIAESSILRKRLLIKLLQQLY